MKRKPTAAKHSKTHNTQYTHNLHTHDAMDASSSQVQGGRPAEVKKAKGGRTESGVGTRRWAGP